MKAQPISHKSMPVGILIAVGAFLVEPLHLEGQRATDFTDEVTAAPRISIEPLPKSRLRLKWQALDSTSYQLQSSTNLADWRTVPVPWPNGGTLIEVSNPLAG